MRSSVLDLFKSMDLTPFAPVIKYLPASFKSYDYSVKATFNMMYQKKEVNHAYFPELFGIIRERFAALIPDFQKEIGEKYLLKTVHGHYLFFDDFVFHENIKTRMYVFDVNKRCYSLLCVFGERNRIKAIASQKLFYLPLKKKEKRIPINLEKFISAFDSNRHFNEKIRNYMKIMKDYGRNQCVREIKDMICGKIQYIKKLSFKIDSIPQSFMTPEQNMSQSKFTVILNDIIDKNLNREFILKEFNIHYLQDFLHKETMIVDIFIRDDCERYNVWAAFRGIDKSETEESLKTVILASMT